MALLRFAHYVIKVESPKRREKSLWNKFVPSCVSYEVNILEYTVLFFYTYIILHKIVQGSNVLYV